MKRKSKLQNKISDTAAILELSDYEFKIILINMLKPLMAKLDNMQEQMGGVGREMETLRNKRKC